MNRLIRQAALLRKPETAKSLCVFDMDGTLVDSMGTFAAIAGRLAKERYGLTFEKARGLYLETSGIPFFQQMESLFPGDRRNDETARLFEQEKKKGYFDALLFDGAEQVLLELRRRGIRTAVSSNNFHELVCEFAEKRRLPCDFVLGFRPGFAKGEDHFNHLKAALGIGASEMIFVGDSLQDGDKARRCGVDFIAKAGTFSAKEFQSRFPDSPVIETFFQLTDHF